MRLRGGARLTYGRHQQLLVLPHILVHIYCQWYWRQLSLMLLYTSLLAATERQNGLYGFTLLCFWTSLGPHRSQSNRRSDRHIHILDLELAHVCQTFAV